VNADFDAALQTIPVCASGFDCGGRRIWRRSGGHDEFRFVTDLFENTTTTYVDTVLNDDLGEVLIEGNTRVPPLSCLIEHNSRLIGLSENELVISNKNEPWYCPESPDLELGDPNLGTRHTIQSRDGTPVGLCEHGSVVAVFTSSKGYFLSGDQPIEFALDEFTSHGCVSHRTIESAMGLLLWLAPDGVYAWDGTREARISDDQRATIDAMTAAEMAASFAFVWDAKYFLCWPTGAIVFDLVHRLWTTNTNWLWACGAVSKQSGSAKEKVYAAAYGVARVHQLETGATDNGTTISARWASKDVDLGYPGRDKRCHYIRSRWKKGTGQAVLTLKKGSGQTVQQEVFDISEVEHVDETAARQIASCVEQARSEFFRLDITIASTASEVELLEAGLEFTVAS
jgi:hypothetical protein